MARSAGTVEHTDSISAEDKNSPNESLGNDIKQSDGTAPVMLELWEMRNTPLFPSLPGPLWPGVVATYRGLSKG